MTFIFIYANNNIVLSSKYFYTFDFIIICLNDDLYRINVDGFRFAALY